MNEQKTQRVSVIIPTCDRPHQLRTAVGSVLEQGLAASEIVVVDNGIVPLPDNWLSERVRVVRTEPRIGISKARNLGAKYSTCELLAFLDDDDYWDNDYLFYMTNVFNRTGSICVAKIVNLSEDGRRLDERLIASDRATQYMVYHRNPHFGGSNFLMRRSTFCDIGGFDENLPASEDRDIAARLLNAGNNLVPVKDAVAYAVHHSGARSTPNHLSGNLKFFRKHFWNMSNYSKYKNLMRFTKSVPKRRLLSYIQNAFMRMS